MLRKVINSKAFYVVLSILLAVIFWVYVDMTNGDEITQTISNIPVTFDGEETLENRGLMIVHDETSEYVTLRVRGKRNVVLNLNKDNVVVTVKTSQIDSEGEQSLEYTVSYPSTVQAGSVTVMRKSPETVTIQVMAVKSTQVPVRTELTGSVAEGYYGGEIVCSPETITLVGREDVVTQVAYAKVTIDTQNLTESISADLPYQLYDSSGNLIESTELTASSDTVAVSMVVAPMKEIPLTVAIQEGGGATEQDIEYTIEPESIFVAGDTELLSELDSIELGTIDLSDVLLSPSSLTLDIPLPDGLTNISGETSATVTVTVNGLSTKTLDVTNIVLLRTPANYTVSQVTQRVSVTLRGPKESLDAVTADNVLLSVDVGAVDLTSGSFGNITVPATVTISGYSDVGAVGDYTVVLSIN